MNGSMEWSLSWLNDDDVAMPITSETSEDSNFFPEGSTQPLESLYEYRTFASDLQDALEYNPEINLQTQRCYRVKMEISDMLPSSDVEFALLRSDVACRVQRESSRTAKTSPADRCLRV